MHPDWFLPVYPANSYRTHTDSAIMRLQCQNHSGVLEDLHPWDTQHPQVHEKRRLVQQGERRSETPDVAWSIDIRGVHSPRVNGKQHAFNHHVQPSSGVNRTRNRNRATSATVWHGSAGLSVQQANRSAAPQYVNL